jgi:hypothetical protein
MVIIRGRNAKRKTFVAHGQRCIRSPDSLMERLTTEGLGYPKDKPMRENQEVIEIEISIEEREDMIAPGGGETVLPL